jgi:hypothetical protein
MAKGSFEPVRILRPNGNFFGKLYWISYSMECITLILSYI